MYIWTVQPRLACEQALLFGQAKRAARERASEGPLVASLLARLVSLAQIGEHATRYHCKHMPQTCLGNIFVATTERQQPLSFDANFSSFSLADSPPRDMQITAYK